VGSIPVILKYTMCVCLCVCVFRIEFLFQLKKKKKKRFRLNSKFVAKLYFFFFDSSIDGGGGGGGFELGISRLETPKKKKKNFNEFEINYMDYYTLSTYDLD
jgi:hypothetical protein